MREIKFRAWNLYKKEMNSWEEYSISICRLLVGGIKGFTLMQFTGLKDKNGKEIYEGDIVQKWEFENPYTLNEKKKGRLIRWGIWAVEWDNHKGFVINNKENFRKYGIHGIFGGGQLENCEIIGNIYENPELLKSTDKTSSSEDSNEM